MQEIPDLTPIYVAHAPPAPAHSGAHLSEDLEPLLRELLMTAQAAWPELALSPEDFVAHLGKHTPPGSEPERLLRSLHVEDLYLACACARGQPKALRAFEEHYLAQVAGWLTHEEALQDMVTETQQVLRERLMVGARPRIAEFSGQGALRSWLRIAAVRVAVDLHRQRRGQPLDGENDTALQEAALAVEGDPELDLVKARCWEDFKQAFAAAMVSLAPAERTMLRLYYIEELTQEEIARMLRVERSTVSRWVAKVRKTMFDETRRRLQERLGLSAEGFESMLRLIRSQFDQSMARLLRLEDAA